MKRICVPAFAIVISLFMLQSCKKEAGPAGPQGPAGPILSGNLFGFVDLLDQYGNKIIVGNDGIQVTLDGTGKSTYTNSNGKYQFDSLATGVYNLTFSKAGFGTMRLLTQQFIGGGDVDRDTKMSIVPAFSVSSLTATIDTANVTLTAPLSSTDTRLRTAVFFLGANSAVSSDPANYLLSYNKQTTNGNLNTAIIKIPIAELQSAGFGSGSTLYFSAYGASASFASSSTYEDLNSGRSYFNGLSSNASTVSIVMP